MRVGDDHACAGQWRQARQAEPAPSTTWQQVMAGIVAIYAMVVSLLSDRRVQAATAAGLALVASVLLGSHEASAGLSTSSSRPWR
jgi:hypothetical protein